MSSSPKSLVNGYRTSVNRVEKHKKDIEMLIKKLQKNLNMTQKNHNRYYNTKLRFKTKYYIDFYTNLAGKAAEKKARINRDINMLKKSLH